MDVFYGIMTSIAVGVLIGIFGTLSSIDSVLKDMRKSSEKEEEN